MIVISIETTGLPGRDWDPRVIAVGLCEARDDGTIGESTGGYVRQPEWHVMHPSSQGAFYANQIDPRLIIEADKTPEEVAAQLRAITAYQQLFAFNVKFHEHLLRKPPWHITTFGADLQHVAAHYIHGPGRKRASFPDTLAWLTARGVKVLDGLDDMHPVEAKAVKVARVAIAFAKIHEHGVPPVAEGSREDDSEDDIPF